MNIIPFGFAAPGVVFILTLAVGFWLSRLGRPYNGLLFNVHKLIALAAVVVTVVPLIRTFKSADLSALPVALLVLAAFCVVALFASGALMSAGSLNRTLLHRVHLVALAALAVALPAAVLLFARRL